MRHTSLILPLTSASGAVILISCIGAFVGLGASSFWTDKLFTAYFADPDQATLQEVLSRAAEDVNPAVYYSFLWAYLRATGLDFVLGSRGLSAFLGVLAIAAIVLAPTKTISIAPRLVAGAFAASSSIWFYVTQEARAYALSLFLVACITGCALRVLESLRVGRPPYNMITALTLLSLVASLSHYYTVLLVGGFYSILLGRYVTKLRNEHCSEAQRTDARADCRPWSNN